MAKTRDSNALSAEQPKAGPEMTVPSLTGESHTRAEPREESGMAPKEEAKSSLA